MKPVHTTIIQFFHWYYSPEGNLWAHVKDKAAWLADTGITHVWLPPAYKSADGVNEPGYAVYDLYDLGEFDQKGTVRTRYGTRDEYLAAIQSLKEKGLQVLADIVLNHRMGADDPEVFPARQVREENRNEFIGEEKTIEAFTRFTFHGRGDKYSSYKWDWHSFSGVSLSDGMFMIINEYTRDNGWEPMLEDEKGNFDLVMGCDLDFRNPHVVEELIKWGHWYIETTGIDGFRLDALKHITPGFYTHWLQQMNDHFQKNFFCIGEYWKNNAQTLQHYIEATEGRIQLVDVPLHFNFYEASMSGDTYDLRQIFDNTLVQAMPDKAITFVDNHDTQPLQSLHSPVDFWFKSLAYALILLRQQGTPTVFYPILFEAKYTGHENGKEVYVELNTLDCVSTMIWVRRNLCYGNQHEYFQDANVIGWTVDGIEEYEHSGIAVLMSNKDEASKWMYLGPGHTGKTFVDACGFRKEEVSINENGEGEFFCHGRSVSVWVCRDALT